MSLFALCYDFKAASDLAPVLVPFVKNNRHVNDWSAPFDGLFLIDSESNAPEITESFRDLFGDQVKFLVVRMGEDGAGLLPTSVWKWTQSLGHKLTYTDREAE